MSPSIAAPVAVPPSFALPRYLAGLPAGAVDRNLRQVLVACDQAQAGLVLWLAEVQRRGLCRALGQPSVLQYATETLGMSRPRAFDLLQLARDLERLPHLRAAMASGAIGWTKARLVARVATAADEEAWVATARRLGRRALAARIVEEQERAHRRREERRRQRAAQLAGQANLGWSDEIPPATVTTVVPCPVVAAPRPAPAPVAAAPTTPSPPQSEVADRPAAPAARRGSGHIILAEPPSALTYRLTGIELARYEALLEQAHRRRCLPPQASREEVLLAAMAALVVSANDGGKAAVAATRPDLAIAYQIVIYRCRTCGAAEVVTGRGRRVLTSVEAEAVQCDARILEPGAPNRATIAPSIRALVLARDQHRCQAPGCGRTGFLEIHHVVPRAEGGANRPENLMTLCGRCHRFAHERPQLAQQWFRLRNGGPCTAG